MFQVNNTDTLKSVHFAYFHSVMEYELILGEGDNSNSSKDIPTLQKETVALSAGVKFINSCSSLFNRFRHHTMSTLGKEQNP
jgi:hypothetical protein